MIRRVLDAMVSVGAYLRHNPAVTMLLGVVLSVALSILAVLIVDALKQENIERDNIREFSKLLEQYENDLAFSYWANIRYVQTTDDIQTDETVQFDTALETLIDYLDYNEIDTDQRAELMAIFHSYSKYRNPVYFSGLDKWIPPSRSVVTFMSLLDDLEHRIDFLPYERTAQVSDAIQEVFLCDGWFGFYSLQEITFNVSHLDCPMDATYAMYNPDIEQVTWLDDIHDELASPMPVALPTPTPVALPTSTSTPWVPPNFSTTDTAGMWVQIVEDLNSIYKQWDVLVSVSFDVPKNQLEVYIDGFRFCNTYPIYGGRPNALECERYYPRNPQPEVYAVWMTDNEELRYECVKHASSSETASIHACQLQ